MVGETTLAANAVIPGAAAAPVQATPARPAPCLMINPNSFSAARSALASRAADVARARGAEVVQVFGASDFDAALKSVIEKEQQALFVLAGDGTVQAVVDRLASLPADVPRPQLLVLGGGRSNVIAADLRGRGAVLRKLEMALDRYRHGGAFKAETRHALTIEQPPAPTRHGFLLAAGLVDAAIRACHQLRSSGSAKLRMGGAGTLWALAGLALPAMAGIRQPPIDALHIDVSGHDALSEPARWLVLTTLPNPWGMLDPYARRGEGALRFTAIAAQGFPFWARLPRIALGRFTPAMNAGRGYMSGCTDAVRVLGLSSYTLDGEEFASDPARPVIIRTGPSFSFLTL
jgi:hypothetical protein